MPDVVGEADVVGEGVDDKPKRKAMFLGPKALRNLRVTAARRRTEREAVEEALELLARQDARLDAMAAFVDYAAVAWGEPSDEERRRAEEIWSRR